MDRQRVLRRPDFGSASLRRTRAGFLGLAALAGLAGAQGPTRFHSEPRPVPHPPHLRTSLPPHATVEYAQELHFRVLARDPDGERVSLTLLNPPPGMVFDPVHGARTAVVEARWSVAPLATGPHTLVFEARDASGERTTLAREVFVRGETDSSILIGDVTGDGVLDVVASAEEADVGGVVNAGSIHVWAGASVPKGAPTASLSVPGALMFDELGSLGFGSGQAVQLADVTGDGVADVVALAEHAGAEQDGALYVFEGGASLTGAVAPRATLSAPGAGGLGRASGCGLVLGDVTGDGVRDLVVAAQFAKVGGMTHAGAIYFVAGGASLGGTLVPVVLSVPGSVTGHLLGSSDGQAVQLADVTGDGALDIVVGAKRADVRGVQGAGAVYVWAGGGVPDAAPSAILTVGEPVTGDQLGSQAGHQGVQLADVTDDGLLDVVVGAELADVAGKINAGAIYVFEGGPALAGECFPRARLSMPGATHDERFGPDRDEAFRIADVTGDGKLEIIGVASQADVNGVDDVGALLVFRIGPPASPPVPLPPLATPAPIATLSVPGAVSGDRLANSTNRGLYLVDLTGDGVLDLVTNTVGANLGGAGSAGAIHVFAGGALSGAVAPLATLAAPGAAPGDRLGGDGLRFADLTRDGKLDVVANSRHADRGGVADTGEIQLFAGDGGFAGALAPRATLRVPGAALNDRLGLTALADVTGDGALDVVARATSDFAGFHDVGAIYVFEGSRGFKGEVRPTATMVLSRIDPGENVNARWIADLDADGILDIVASARTGGGTVVDGGAILVYSSGALWGRNTPDALLLAPVPPVAPGSAPDRMDVAAIADLTGDGKLDVLGYAPTADVAGVPDAGALYLFVGASGLQGEPGATVLSVPGAQPGDQLGR